MRKEVAFACEQFQVSERRACKLLGMDRGSYRYEPRADRNGPLREALVALSRQKPRTANRPCSCTRRSTSITVSFRPTAIAWPTARCATGAKRARPSRRARHGRPSPCVFRPDATII
jgi:hypothetical protein